MEKNVLYENTCKRVAVAEADYKGLAHYIPILPPCMLKEYAKHDLEINGAPSLNESRAKRASRFFELMGH